MMGRAGLVACALLAGCFEASPPEAGSEALACDLLTPARPNPPPPDPTPNAANASMYAPLTTIDLRVRLTSADWDQLMVWKAQGLKNHVPCEFEHDGEVFEKAALRLKGNESRWAEHRKEQFVIRFDYYDGGGRFRGLRRLNLDSEGVAPVRNNVGMHLFREAGVPAPRTNHARLAIDVTDADAGGYPQGYFGLYENIEAIDREFLEDRFPDPTGNLYKHGTDLKTNKDPGNQCDREELASLVDAEPLDGDHAAFFARLSEIADVPWILRHLAVEASVGLGDNFWSGGNNWYLYNDPLRGLLTLPWDVDDILSPVSPPEADPFAFSGVVGVGGDPNRLFQLMIQEPTWHDAFAAEVRRLRDDVLPGLPERVEALCDAIREDVRSDPSRRFTMDEFEWDCEGMRQRVIDREAFLQADLGGG